MQRIHPAASRILKLSREVPAKMIVFDILVDERGVSWIARSLSERRRKLESFAKAFSRGDDFLLSPATQSLAQARRWLRASGGNLDGIMAKRIDAAYRSGDRIHVGIHEPGAQGAARQTAALDPAAGLHRSRAGGPEPLER